MNENIFGGIALNPYAPSGLLSNVISADAYWQQDTTCIGQIQIRVDELQGVCKEYVASDCQTEEQEQGGCLETVFKDGKLLKDYTLAEIRERVDKSLC